MDKSYVDTVRLMLEVMPDVFQSRSFAMKGGTALNFFVQDVRDLIAYCRLAISPHTRKSKRWVKRRGSVPRSETNAGGSGTFARGGDRAAIRP